LLLSGYGLEVDGDEHVNFADLGFRQEFFCARCFVFGRELTSGIHVWRALFRYHLKDAIIGKIYFLLVRVKIKHMEVHIIKRETTGTGPNCYHEDDTIAKFEIMDGAPVKGEICSSIGSWRNQKLYGDL